jgi:hypothetical protein
MHMKSVVCRVAMWLVAASFVGCGGGTEEASDVDRMVYFDTKTKTAVVAEVSDETPALNLTTGRKTLMPALYCPKCESWHSVPPLDQINRIPGATKCRKTGADLTFEGPWPE